MLLGPAFEPIKQLQGNKQFSFVPDKITYKQPRKDGELMNKYEQDRIELLKNTCLLAYLGEKEVFEQTIEANDKLIIKEGARLRGLPQESNTPTT